MTTDEGAGSLERELGVVGLAVYGIGGMLGGGIYALVGEVAGEAGGWSWLSFLTAMVVAGPTALTYAELSSRFPRSGGESVFATRAFNRDDVSFLVGWTVIFSGLVSMATLAHAFAGYLGSLWPTLPRELSIVGFIGVLTLINFRGIRLTSRANIVATTIESSGLVLVIVAGLVVLSGGGDAVAGAGSAGAAGAALASTGQGGGSALPLLGVLSGATLAFYAFIGFEDMVNVAEEVERPRRQLPVAIIVALVVVGLTYVAVNALATATVPPESLAGSSAPLQDVVAVGIPALPGAVFTVIALFAVGNSALLNHVMASRLAYGMADEDILPEWLAAVHPGRSTPHRAVFVVAALALAVALSGTLGALAATTSLLLLSVFFLMNLALVVIKRRESGAPDTFTVPVAVPVLGMVLSVALAAFGPLESLAAAGAVLGVGILCLGILSLRKR